VFRSLVGGAVRGRDDVTSPETTLPSPNPPLTRPPGVATPLQEKFSAPHHVGALTSSTLRSCKSPTHSRHTMPGLSGVLEWPAPPKSPASPWAAVKLLEQSPSLVRTPRGDASPPSSPAAAQPSPPTPAPRWSDKVSLPVSSHSWWCVRAVCVCGVVWVATVHSRHLTNSLFCTSSQAHRLRPAGRPLLAGKHVRQDCESLWCAACYAGAQPNSSYLTHNMH
jgi:hypothetical protein